MYQRTGSVTQFSLILLSRLKLKVARRELRITLLKRLKQDLSLKTKLMSVIRPFLIPLKALILNAGALLLPSSFFHCFDSRRAHFGPSTH